MTATVRFPIETLLRAGLNLGGVHSVNGFVSFEPSKHCVTEARFRRRLDHRFWKKLRAARRKTAGRRGRAARESISPPEQQFLRFITKERRVPRASGPAILEIARYEDASAAESRAAAAADMMRRIAIVDQNGTGYLLSTFDPDRPKIFAQVSPGPGGEIQASLREAMFWGELVLELFTGLLTVMGVKIRRRVDMGRWVERITNIINRSRRLRGICLKLATKGRKLGVKDLFDLIYWLWMDGFTWECLKDAAGDMIDLSFWGIIHLLGKFAARLSPGAGQALLLADLGLIIVELIRKLVTR